MRGAREQRGALSLGARPGNVASRTVERGRLSRTVVRRVPRGDGRRRKIVLNPQTRCILKPWRVPKFGTRQAPLVWRHCALDTPTVFLEASSSETDRKIRSSLSIARSRGCAVTCVFVLFANTKHKKSSQVAWLLGQTRPLAGGSAPISGEHDCEGGPRGADRRGRDGLPSSHFLRRAQVRTATRPAGIL